MMSDSARKEFGRAAKPKIVGCAGTKVNASGGALFVSFCRCRLERRRSGREILRDCCSSSERRLNSRQTTPAKSLAALQIVSDSSRLRSGPLLRVLTDISYVVAHEADENGF